MPYIKDMKKIYSDGRHNAFTDMEYWKGYYYVTFQNAGGHAVPGDYGDILVIRSQNLKGWNVCVRLSSGDDHDDRGLAFLDMGDELGVFFGSSFSKVPGEEQDCQGAPDVRLLHLPRHHMVGSPARVRAQYVVVASRRVQGCLLRDSGERRKEVQVGSLH